MGRVGVHSWACVVYMERFNYTHEGVAYILHIGPRWVHVSACSVHIWTSDKYVGVSNTCKRMVGMELIRQEMKKLFIFYVNVVFKKY